MNILYYPEINIPRTEWAIRAFLYYDEVAAIVPYKYNMEPDSYEPFMGKFSSMNWLHLLIR